LTEYFFIACVALLSIQFIYFILFSFLLFYKEEKRGKSFFAPVSVIVCAHNERHNLVNLIPKLLEQQHPEFEIIVVDDRSIDSTFDFLKPLTDKHSNLKYVKLENEHNPKHLNTKKLAIFLGVKAAKYDILLLTDADCMPFSDKWISSMQECFDENTKVVLGFSPYQTNKSFINQLITFETLFTAVQYLSLAIVGKPYMGVGRNLAYRKSLFLANKGFGDYMNVTGGDDDLFVNQVANSSNTKICFAKDAQMESIPKKTFSEWVTQKKRHYSVGKLYKFSDKLTIGLLMFSLIFFNVFLLLSFFNPNYLPILGIIIGLKIVISTSMYLLLANKLKYKTIWYLLPFVELIYLLYYPFISITSYFAKKIKWT
jgi:cellulose synthase/poly-beta-1,6-N-acetylglucosamine synthase-like glycosyltransferase